jgi:hypothetical protein
MDIPMMRRQNAVEPKPLKEDGTEMRLRYIKLYNKDNISELVKLYNIFTTGLVVYVDGETVEIYKEITEGRPTFHTYYIFVKCTDESNGQTLRECSDGDNSAISCEQRNVGQTILKIMRDNPKYGIDHFTVV